MRKKINYLFILAISILTLLFSVTPNSKTTEGQLFSDKKSMDIKKNIMFTSINPHYEKYVNDTKTCKIKVTYQHYKLEDAIELSDIIAEVRINYSIDEIEKSNQIPKTLFSATVIETLKGEPKLKEINILQDSTATANCTIDNYKPLVNGKEYLLFLKKVSGSEFDETDTYYLIGGPTTIYVVSDKYIIKTTQAEESLKDIEISKLQIYPSDSEKQAIFFEEMKYYHPIEQIFDRVLLNERIISLIKNNKKN